MSSYPQPEPVAPESAAPQPRWREWLASEAACSARELIILCITAALLLFYGLVPLRLGHAVISAPKIGLVGADEPRYAQIAAEMLEEHSNICHELHARVIPHSLRLPDLKKSFQCAEAGMITPILYGHPWLEKPALYYWRTMSFYKEFGKSDWAARLSSATGAFALVFLIFLHMRRFRPGGHLDAALITASAVAIIAFARGASTDMQLAAPFCIGMLGWYAWYETGKKFWLFDLYFFGGLATLAKGPVAIFLSLSIILLFVGLRREWQVLRRMIWLPGIALFLAISLPWFIAVQVRNPTFYKFFLFEQNLQRFATDRYQHHQTPFYYLIVLLLALMPWTVLALRALWDSIDIARAEWRVRHKPARYLGHSRAGDAFPEFLVLWAVFPVLFFSFSGSKLPGYILPAIPPITILTGDYLNRIRRNGLPKWLLIAHGATCGILTFVLLLCPQYMIYQKIVPPMGTLLTALTISIACGAGIVLLTLRFGLKWIRPLTLAPIFILLFFLMHQNGWLLDENYSARPMARQIAAEAPDVKLLETYHIRRDTDYGLCFYRNQPLRHYLQEESATEKQSVITGIPNEEHILVIRVQDEGALGKLLPNRTYRKMFVNGWQDLAVYRVAASTIATLPDIVENHKGSPGAKHRVSRR
ncbi:ArnT family glycosyltransferase [Terriglobus roseus]|uniref:4-amino-4-deoxy-L-arabinose transferase n=1 Tax=Terriglobus roseus TaxID=392734 RepID=A0A1H4RAD8_9BACT|nr:glycosyltransferase family 39 protein [Terriglobus roseus]SEC28823.1 4-amino-4-deoxy-L-arabinose transferase [Terriglobus roseus]